MSEAGGANYQHLGYFGGRCPNGGEKIHVYPVTLTSSSPIKATPLAIGPETRVEQCRACWHARTPESEDTE